MRNERIQWNRRVQSVLPALILLSLCGPARAQGDVTAIRAARVIDGVRSESIDDGVVVVRGEEIVAVGTADEVEVPDGASVVDLPGHTLLPGLIDSHDHPTLRPDSLELQPMIDQRLAPGEEQMLRAIRNMRISLLGGTTTVRVTGESSGIDFQLGKAIDAGVIPGPRIIAAGMPIVATSAGAGPLWPTDGVESIRKRIRENVLGGARFTKMYLSDTSPTTTILSLEEVCAAVDESHRLGIPITSHVVGNWGVSIRVALECGVDSFEHVRPITDEIIELFVEHESHLNITPLIFIPGGIRWSPEIWRRLDNEMTSVEEWIDFNRATIQEARRNNPLGETEDRPQDVFDIAEAGAVDYTPGIRPYQAQLLKAHRRGVPISHGTDTLHGTLLLNIEFLIEGGFTPMEAIQATTRVAADGLGLGMGNRIGTLEPGKLADIISVEGNPLAQIRDLAKVRFIMIEGRRLDPLSFH